MRILIVDDEPIIRRSLLRVGKSLGDEMFEAEDGLLGFEAMKSVKPDLVFLDVLMPKLTGPQMLEKVGDKGDIKVVLMSAYSGEYNLQTAKALGADLFLAKPFDDIFKVFNEAKKLVGGTHD
ncbi:MAG: response regulator [Bdellovibrionaceae bacterium]|nr:response regulator [Pseudobdellovibrionaceae bacterium]